MMEHDDIPLGNGDIVRSRELFDVERRLSARFAEAVDGLCDKLDDRYVGKEGDEVRHDNIEASLSRIERKVDGSLVAIFSGAMVALWAFLRTRLGV